MRQRQALPSMTRPPAAARIRPRVAVGSATGAPVRSFWRTCERCSERDERRLTSKALTSALGAGNIVTRAVNGHVTEEMTSTTATSTVRRNCTRPIRLWLTGLRAPANDNVAITRA